MHVHITESKLITSSSHHIYTKNPEPKNGQLKTIQWHWCHPPHHLLLQKKSLLVSQTHSSTKPWQCQKRNLFIVILTQNVTNIHGPARVSFQLPLLLHLRLVPRFSSLPFSSPFLVPCTSLPLLHGFRSPHFSSPMSSLTSDNNYNATPDVKTVRAVIKGRVQGVFYRDWTVENAKELGLKGWVRNRRDGSVEALFSGSPEKVQEMEQRCRRGPPAAIVTGLDVFPCDDDPGTGFERKQSG